MIGGDEAAFPIVSDRGITFGMSLRTYLAAHAPVSWYVHNSCVQEGARQAVKWADALIAELNK